MTTSRTWKSLAALTGLLLAACSGGGGNPEAIRGTSGDFVVLRTTPTDNGQLFLNDSVAIDFSNPVDVTSANLNTVQFAVFDTLGNALSEQPTGTFQVVDSPGDGSGNPTAGRRLLFTPRFPTDTAFSNGGFKPGRTYVMSLVSGNVTNQTVLRDLNSRPLRSAFSFTFTTADSTDPRLLFRDILAGGPRRRLSNGFAAGPTDDQGRVLLSKAGLSTVELRLRFDQPLNPSTENVPTDITEDPLNRGQGRGRIFLEYDDNALGLTQLVIPTTAELESNEITGAEVVLRPIGVLPNNAEVRVIVESGLQDISGESNVSNQGYDPVFARFTTAPEFAPQFDAILDGFDLVSAFDPDAPLLEPLADFDANAGTLQASFNFDGDASSLDFEPSVRELVLSTDFATVVPVGAPPLSVVGGVFRFRDVTINEDTTVLGRGSNPMVWLLTGDLTVNGNLRVDGSDGEIPRGIGVADNPVAGGVAGAGGGSGGAGSPNSADRSPSGEPGAGPGEAAGLGGGAGLLGCEGCLRGSAGGGGSFATQGDPNFQFSGGAWQQLNGTGGNGCTGSSGGSNRITPGGTEGDTSGFSDTRSENDFWGAGVNVFTGQRVSGELATPIGGSGGGGGGDRSNDQECGPSPLNFQVDGRGGGGGGGGGVLIVQCLGKITVGPDGHITADGGDGAGGETDGSNLSGGGGGGGSGGMVVLMAAEGIDIFTHFEGTNPNIATFGEDETDFAISADGGVGRQSNFRTLVTINNKYDSVPSVPSRNWDNLPTGGFGGMGIVQLMVPPGDDSDGTGNRLDDNIRFLRFDGSGELLEETAQRKKQLLAWRGWPDQLGVLVDDRGNPTDIGADEGDIRPSPVLLPVPFSTLSRARSRWVDIGLARRRQLSTQPGDNTPGVVVQLPGEPRPDPDFSFAATGGVASTFDGYAEYGLQSNVLYPIPEGLDDSYPIQGSIRVLVGDDAFEGTPAYGIDIPNNSLGFEANRYTGHVAELLDAGGQPVAERRILGNNDGFLWVELSGTLPSTAVSVRILAKFFRVFTNGAESLGPTFDVLGALTPIANVQIGFAFSTDPTNPAGRFPVFDPVTSPLPGFVYDLENDPDFQAWLAAGNRPRYVQWDVLFNARFHPTNPGNDSGAPLTADVPLPALQYLVLPYRF